MDEALQPRMCVDETSRRLFSTPGIHHGFIQHTCGRELYEMAKTVFGDRDYSGFRVCIWTEKELSETSGEVLADVVRAGLEKLKIEIPEWL